MATMLLSKAMDVLIRKERGVSAATAMVILVAAIAAAGVTVFYISSPASGSNSCPAVNSQAGSSASGVRISMYSGAGNPSNAPGYRPYNVILVMGVNNTITWTNDDSAAHTVTSTSAPSCASFDSGNMNSGAAYTLTFAVPGTYQYDCKYHSWMTGTIVVKVGA
jgi:plastocyanin